MVHNECSPSNPQRRLQVASAAYNCALQFRRLICAPQLDVAEISVCRHRRRPSIVRSSKECRKVHAIRPHCVVASDLKAGLIDNHDIIVTVSVSTKSWKVCQDLLENNVAISDVDRIIELYCHCDAGPRARTESKLATTKADTIVRVASHVLCFAQVVGSRNVRVDWRLV